MRSSVKPQRVLLRFQGNRRSLSRPDRQGCTDVRRFRTQHQRWPGLGKALEGGKPRFSLWDAGHFPAQLPERLPSGSGRPARGILLPRRCTPGIQEVDAGRVQAQEAPNDLNGKVKQGSIPAPSGDSYDRTSIRLRRFRHLARIQAWRYRIGISPVQQLAAAPRLCGSANPAPWP